MISNATGLVRRLHADMNTSACAAAASASAFTRARAAVPGSLRCDARSTNWRSDHLVGASVGVAGIRARQLVRAPSRRSKSKRWWAPLLKHTEIDGLLPPAPTPVCTEQASPAGRPPHVFDDITLLGEFDLNLTALGEPGRMHAERVFSNPLPMADVRVQFGRRFFEEERSKTRMWKTSINSDWTFTVTDLFGPAKLRLKLREGWAVRAML